MTSSFVTYKNDSELFQSVLKSHGSSVTKQRHLVFERLHFPKPQSMAELLKRCDRSIDRATLYRIIQLFENTGIVQRVAMGWKYKLELSDMFSKHHHHLLCLSCNAHIATDENSAVEALLQDLAKRHDFMPTKHQIEIQGYCRQCRANLKTPAISQGRWKPHTS